MATQAMPSATTAETANAGWAGWYAVTVLCLALIVSFTDRLVINLVVDPIRGDLGLSDIQISFLQGAGFAVIFALAGLPSGRLADAVHRRNLIMAGISIWSAATMCCGLAPDFWSFFAARVVVGLGEAALIPAASSLIIDLFSPKRRGLALGLFSLGATFGTGTALFVGGLVLLWSSQGHLAGLPFIGTLAPWRQLFFVVGLPGIVLLPFLAAITEPARNHSAGLLPLSGVVIRLIANNGAVLRVCLVKGALGAGDYALISWLPTLLQRSYAMSPLEAGGMVAASITISGVIASVGGGALSDWVVRRWGMGTRAVVLLFCYGLTVLGAIGICLSGSGQAAALAFGVWALGSIAGYVVGHVVMQESVPNEMRATTIALSLSVTSLVGLGLGPTLVPLVALHVLGSEAALQPAMGIVGLGAAAAAVIIIWPPASKALLALRAGGVKQT